MKAPLFSRRGLLSAGSAGLASLLLPQASLAQAFPSRPVTVIVPYAVGGPVDLIARSLQEPLTKSLGQTLIVDSKPGASGLLATRQVARSPADGHTLLIQTPNILIAPQLSKSGADVSPLQDFEPVTMLASQPFVMLTHPSVPARNMRELIAYLKANPDKVEYGSAGTASFSRLSTELLMSRTNTRMIHIPYKGVGASMQAIYTGEIKVLLSSMSPQIQQFVNQGKVNILGVATLEPSPLVPRAEPIAKTVPGFEAVVWTALFAPKGTPRDVVEKIAQAVHRMQADADYKSKAATLAVEIDTMHGDALKAKLQREYKTWGDVVRKANITEE